MSVFSLLIAFSLLPYKVASNDLMTMGVGPRVRDVAAVIASSFTNTNSMKTTGSIGWVQQTDAIVGNYNLKTGAVSVWFYASNSSASYFVFGHQASFADAFMLFRNANGTLGFRYRTNAGGTQFTITTTGAIPASNWTHWLWTYDFGAATNSRFTFYTAGVGQAMQQVTAFSANPQPQDPATQLVNATAVYVVGHAGTGATPWRGNIDEFCMVTGRVPLSNEFDSAGLPIDLTNVANKHIWLRFETNLGTDEIRANLWTTNTSDLSALDLSTNVPGT